MVNRRFRIPCHPDFRLRQSAGCPGEISTQWECRDGTGQRYQGQIAY